MRSDLFREPDGTVVVEPLPGFLLDVLREVPGHLVADRPGPARDRLLPYPRDDRDAREEWARHVHPELFALLASAREVVEADLAAAVPSAVEDGAYRLEIPPTHVAGWVRALQGARLSLGADHGIDADDMAELDPFDRKAPALYRIAWLGGLQAALLDESGD